LGPKRGNVRGAMGSRQKSAGAISRRPRKVGTPTVEGFNPEELVMTSKKRGKKGSAMTRSGSEGRR